MIVDEAGAERSSFSEVESIVEEATVERTSWGEEHSVVERTSLGEEEDSVDVESTGEGADTVFEAKSPESREWEDLGQEGKTEAVDEAGWEVHGEDDHGPGRDFDISTPIESEKGIDKTVDDIIGLLGGQEEEESIESALVTPSLLRIKRPSLCVNCKKIIKKGLSGLKCPQCSKVMHMECGKGKGKCPECGTGFK